MPSAFHDPYDADTLPEYPPHDAGRAGTTAARRGADSKGDDEAARLVKGGRREGEPVPLEVDGFAYELGRVHHDVDTFHDAVARLTALKAQVLALEPEDSTLVAQSLLASLAVQTADSSQLFKQLPQQIKTFGDKLPFLKPGAGRFLVTSAESMPLQSELAACATTLRSAVHEVHKLADVEEKEKQSARVRLLKTIKAQMGLSGDDSLVMAALLTAEREGSSHFAEQLKAGSPSWRWAVERPFSRLGADIGRAGDLSFLDRLEAVPPPSSSSWLNPLVYLPLGLARKGAPGVGVVDGARPPSAPPTYSPFALRSGERAGFSPLVDADEEDRLGSYGERLDEPPRAAAPTKWARVALGVVVLAVLLGSAVALTLWTRHVDEYDVSQDSMAAGLGGLA
ncbi:hypothetical protein JCM3775_001189 [Rhodotorula graminis]|uniref:Uncharacterized protein n=1 Tax=Rhodotorula graminis (strain WP1) TaxID=578459 RepID=A0A194SCG3_RHOGW|nr:uncharacterized protein RHOBADRAFT_40841 [Rhodotorula graminis WP1]KPV78294.1 hypothetical protein RHOBADRAFT_40841 [Rhodotorula graminis WP1]